MAPKKPTSKPDSSKAKPASTSSAKVKVAAAAKKEDKKASGSKSSKGRKKEEHSEEEEGSGEEGDEGSEEEDGGKSSRQVNSLSSFVNHAGSLLISSLKTEKGGHVVLKDIEMKARESKTEKKTLGWTFTQSGVTIKLPKEAGHEDGEEVVASLTFNINITKKRPASKGKKDKPASKKGKAAEEEDEED